MLRYADKLALAPSPPARQLPPSAAPGTASALQVADASASGLAPHIVIVGGGAGGLVLATRLGDRLARRGRARVTLVDCALTHLWKPLLHEIAAGTLSVETDGLDYFAHARDHGFAFELGRMSGLDRARREIVLDAVSDAGGAELVPGRRLGYDILVIAVGSVLNDFGVPGVREHGLYLDSQAEAERIHRRILGRFLHGHVEANGSTAGQRLRIAIVGAGATGVEFAAELRHAARQLVGYGLRGFAPDEDVEIRLIEAAPCVLPALPERLQTATARQLEAQGIEIHTGQQVARVTAAGVHTQAGQPDPCRPRRLDRGRQGPALARRARRPRGQPAGSAGGRADAADDPRRRHLRARRLRRLPQPGGERPVPPRAQAAHQEAYRLARSLIRRQGGKPMLPFLYKDYGSLISLSSSTIGNLMGNLFKSVTIEGRLARLAYLWLYKRHQVALHGLGAVTLTALANLLHRRARPQLKLH